MTYTKQKPKKKKKKKYKPIVDWLNLQNLKTIYIHINVNSNYSNIEQELEKIRDCQIKEFDTVTFFRTMDIIEDKKNWVNENIDKEIFEILKNKDKQRDVSEDNIPEVNFKDNLKYENIGSYQDLDIDLELFEKYNKEYTNVEELIDTNKEFNEQNLVNYLKEILESKK